MYGSELKSGTARCGRNTPSSAATQLTCQTPQEEPLSNITRQASAFAISVHHSPDMTRPIQASINTTGKSLPGSAPGSGDADVGPLTLAAASLGRHFGQDAAFFPSHINPGKGSLLFRGWHASARVVRKDISTQQLIRRRLSRSQALYQGRLNSTR